MIETKNLRKVFGPIRAVDNVSLSVGKGEVLGFLGPNGAGKSTTMKMITGFLRPTSGRVSVAGHDVLADPIAVKSVLGYLPEGAPGYPDMTPAGFLRFVAEVRGLKGRAVKRRIAEVGEHVHLEGVMRQPIETLSKGYRRRVGLAAAIVHDPDVLILDEPTDGLDPNQKHEVRRLIRRMAGEKCVVLSTHILEEVEAVCTRAVIIARGKLVTDGTPAELRGRAADFNAVTLRVGGVDPGTAGGLAEALGRAEGVAAVERLETGDGSFAARVLPAGGRPVAHEVGRVVRDHGLTPDELSVEPGRLDEVFRMATTGELPPGADKIGAHAGGGSVGDGVEAGAVEEASA